MTVGKRGPNGGVIDIDDPAEVMPIPPQMPEWWQGVHGALSLVEWAARERIAGRDENAKLMLTRATNRLVRVIEEAMIDAR